MDHAFGLVHIGNGYLAHAALFVGQHDGLAANLGRERVARRRLTLVMALRAMAILDRVASSHLSATTWLAG
jgi:hypothetical protein